MKYDVKSLEKCAMSALDMTEPLSPTESLNIDDIAATAGIDPVQGKLAIFMQDELWATLNFGPNPARLHLTLAGRKAIEKFRQSRWRRWIDANPGLWLTILTPIMSLVCAVILKFLERWWGLK